MYKKIMLSVLSIAGTFSLAAQQDPRVAEWEKLFYIDANLDQSYLNGIASFICYMMEKEPSEQCFNRELKKIRKSFKDAPNYFQQSLVRLFSNSFSQAYKMSKTPATPSTDVWKTALQGYYQSVYPLLDATHKTFNYGAKKGTVLAEFA